MLHLQILNQLGQLAVALHLLSIAIAAPAEYVVLPVNPNSAILGGSNGAEIILPTLSENPTQREIRSYISASAQKNGVNEFMALFIAENESHFRQYVIGDNYLICKRTGKPIRSRGIWQINDCAWPEIEDDVAFDVEKSTKWAMEKLKEKPEIWSTYSDFLKTKQLEE